MDDTPEFPSPPPAKDGIFAEIAELAAELCGASFAAVTLHERSGHVPLAIAGDLPLATLPEDSRFCCEVLHSRAPLEVSDAHFDIRFHDDPLVAGRARVRFYSGVPLMDERGHVIGTLSVMDERAKVLRESQRAALWKLADVLVRLLDDIAARRAGRGGGQNRRGGPPPHDTLTELGNRRQFEVALARHLESARAHGQRHAVLFIDLDQFKVVNDTCGHLAGDALLKELARVLAAKMRRGDCLARLGGDEFAVLLEGCDLARGQHVAQQLLAAIRAFRFAWKGQVFRIGASIGVAAITAQSRDSERVLSAADTACYMAKDKGRNQVQVYSEEDEEVSSRHGEMGWVSRINHCAEEGRFFLHCQRVVPIHSAAEGAEYLELLLRMRDEHGKVIPPSSFIPAAERYHLMGTIDRWVVGRALGCLGAIHARSCGNRALPRFGINLSGMSLGDPAFSDFVLEKFESSGTPPGHVCFEITETAAISNLARAARFIDRFRGLGCRFALDDFGAGLSSFAYLKTLPVDYLKIDGSFVRGSCCDPVDLAAVEAVQRLARAVGARTIAESVETAEMLERMRILGIDLAQGHLIQYPEPYPLLAARMDYARDAACAAQAA
jgi:diguanylate cyclase (GGDEF)-like protein